MSPRTAPSLRSRVRHWLKVLGPGLITGAADDDPSGISTYSIAGASTGYSSLWFALVSTPMMAVIQGMAARIGMVTGRGLTSAMRQVAPEPLVWVLVGATIFANTLNAGADLAGMAAATRIVVGGHLILWAVVYAVLISVGVVYLSYRRFANVLKWLALSLAAYAITAFIVHPPWGTILLRTVVPEIHFSGAWLTTIVALFGTTISPYLFFFQTSLVVEDEKRMGRVAELRRKGATEKEIADTHLDVNAGMTASNLAAFFVIVTTAATLYAHGITNIATAQDAAQALRPLAGEYAFALFAIGIVAVGLLGVPALAGSSAYIVADLFGLRQGLDAKFRRAQRFYGVILASAAFGVVMIAVGIDPIRALYWSAVVNGVVAVPLLVILTVICNRRDVLGAWTNSPAANFWAIAATAVMGAAAILMFVFWGRS